MKMYSASKKEYSKIIFDSHNLPKSYGVNPGHYEIEILNQGQYKIVPLQPCTQKNINNIEALIDTLVYSAHGYKDCELSLKKYTQLMSLFSDAVSGEKMIDFKLSV